MPHRSPSTLRDLRPPRPEECARCAVFAALCEAGVAPEADGPLCSRFRLGRARRRQILYLEGSPGTEVFALRTGAAKLYKVDSAGAERIVGLARPGDLLGLGALFGTPRAETAELTQDAEVCVVGREDLTALVEEVPGLGLALAAWLHRQLVRSRAAQACMSAVGVKARLASWLLLQAEDGGGDPPGVDRDLTLAELGGALGAAGESVCRALGAMKRQGVVAVGEGRIDLMDLPALRRAARLG